jgi:ubiquinone biosynthesis protein
MSEQIGWRGLLERMRKESEQWSHLLPQLPRLLHRSLEESSRPHPMAGVETELARIAREQRRLRTMFVMMSLALIAVLVLAFWRD